MVLLAQEPVQRNSKTELVFEEISMLLQDESTRKMIYKILLGRREQDGLRLTFCLSIWSLDPSLHCLICMPVTAGDLSLAAGICLCLMHPSYCPLTNWIMGLTLQHSQVGNLRAGHGLHHRRGVMSQVGGQAELTGWGTAYFMTLPSHIDSKSV